MNHHDLKRLKYRLQMAEETLEKTAKQRDFFMGTSKQHQKDKDEAYTEIETLKEYIEALRKCIGTLKTIIGKKCKDCDNICTEYDDDDWEDFGYDSGD